MIQLSSSQSIKIYDFLLVVNDKFILAYPFLMKPHLEKNQIVWLKYIYLLAFALKENEGNLNSFIKD